MKGNTVDELNSLLDHPLPDIDAVVDLLGRIQQPVADRLPSLAPFNELYRIITIAVNDKYKSPGAGFKNPEFLRQLDVRFAERYVAAARAFLTAGDPPVCWRELFLADPGRVDGTQLAASGVCAHICFDLAFATVIALDDQGLEPDDNSDQHEDYLAVNDIFYAEIPDLLTHFQDAAVHGQHLGHPDIDNQVADLLVEESRGVAWLLAKQMWPDRSEARAMSLHEGHVDRQAKALIDVIGTHFAGAVLGLPSRQAAQAEARTRSRTPVDGEIAGGG